MVAAPGHRERAAPKRQAAAERTGAGRGAVMVRRVATRTAAATKARRGERTADVLTTSADHAASEVRVASKTGALIAIWPARPNGVGLPGAVPATWTTTIRRRSPGGRSGNAVLARRRPTATRLHPAELGVDLTLLISSGPPNGPSAGGEEPLPPPESAVGCRPVRTP